MELPHDWVLYGPAAHTLWVGGSNDGKTAVRAKTAAGNKQTEVEEIVFRRGHEGTLVRLSQCSGANYLFISDGVHWLTLRHTVYMVHESQFTVRWVGEGQNTMGSRLTGSSCEAAWTFNKGKACQGCRGLFRPDEVLECINCAKTFCGTCMDAERVCRGCDGSEDE